MHVSHKHCKPAILDSKLRFGVYAAGIGDQFVQLTIERRTFRRRPLVQIFALVSFRLMFFCMKYF